jgi:hypothetical protein
MFKTVGRTVRYEIHKISIWNKEVLPEWRESIIVPIYKKGDKTDLVIIGANHFCQPRKKILSSILISRLTPDAEEVIGDYQC